jgi:hypothetical protein
MVGSGVSVHDRATIVALVAVVAVLGLPVSGADRPATAQVVSTPQERFFRYLYRLQRVQLHAHVMDQAGQVTHDAFTAIDDIPPGGRVTFRLALAVAGARYAVTVHAFEFGPRESP